MRANVYMKLRKPRICGVFLLTCFHCIKRSPDTVWASTCTTSCGVLRDREPPRGELSNLVGCRGRTDYALGHLHNATDGANSLRCVDAVRTRVAYGYPLQHFPTPIEMCPDTLLVLHQLEVRIH